MGRAYPIELTNMCMLRRSDGRVLVQDRADPQWGGLTFPGGHIEPGESLAGSVIREMQEETGLTIHHPRLVGAKNWMQPGGKERHLVLLYVAEEYEGELRDSDEGRVRWMTLNEMRAGKLAEGMELYFDILLEQKASEIWYSPWENGWQPPELL